MTKRYPGFVLYDRFDPVALKRTRVVRDTETGLPLIITQQNTLPIIEDCKIAATAMDRHQRRNQNVKRSGMVQVASIPLVVWLRLKATGIAKDDKALRKWLSERDNRAFRTDDGRKLA